MGSGVEEHASVDAAEGGYLETLKWLKSTGYPWAKDGTYRAASGGNLELLF